VGHRATLGGCPGVKIPQASALALDGASLFDPMGNGRVMRDTVLLPRAR
jgi:hypothetical protein